MSKKDETIRKIIEYVLREWPVVKDLSEAEKRYFVKRMELNVNKRCLFWGLRAIIPTSMRPLVLNELHATHLGIVKIKMFTRSYVWWPRIDIDIESLVKEYKICLIEHKKPPHTPLTTWPWPTKTWSCIHCNFAGPFYENMYLIVIEAHSKWPEVINLKNNTKAHRLVEVFKDLVAHFGLITLRHERRTTVPKS